MAALEHRLFDAGMPVAALMEKAALALSQRILADEPSLTDGVTVLVGPGHNGGDGLVIARELALAGHGVRVWCPFERLKPLTQNHLRYLQLLDVERLDSPPQPQRPGVWIDALFGLGQRRPLEGAVASLAEEVRTCGRRCWAVDVPSGLSDSSGEPLGPCFPAARTFALGAVKRGLLGDRALSLVGHLEPVPLGVPPSLLRQCLASAPTLLWPEDCHTFVAPQPPAAAGKYGRGRLLMLAGSRRYPGAFTLALAGADASGAGAIHAWIPQGGEDALLGRHPHVLVFGGSPAGDQLSWPGLSGLDRFDALLVGPGIGPAPFEPVQWAMLQAFRGLLVLDADGLNRLASLGQAQAQAWLRARAGATWLTPHGAEARRLFGDLPGDRLDQARAAARASRTTVLLKGPRTAIAASDGRCWQLAQASAEAARAGLGDVLAGYAAGLAARFLASGQPADPTWLAVAALDHGSAGLELQASGRRSFTPLDVAAALARPGSFAARNKQGKNYGFSEFL